jgi:hypothetical protein
MGQEKSRTMRRVLVYALLLTAALGAVSCGDDDPPTSPDVTPPVSLTEEVSGTLTINGAVTHPFVVQRAGNITATLTAVSGDPAPPLSVSLGTFNGASCTIVIANDNAVVGAATAVVVGTATATGNYCLRIVDPGTLKQAVDYVVSITHY